VLLESSISSEPSQPCGIQKMAFDAAILVGVQDLARILWSVMEKYRHMRVMCESCDTSRAHVDR
jgi:hypothetical protein